MDINVPTFNSSSIRAWLRGADPRQIDASKLKASLSMPTIELPSKSSIDDAGHQAAAMAGDAGKAAVSAATDAGRVISSALESAGDRLRDLRSTVAPTPKPSMLKRGAVAVAVASVIGSIAAAVAFVVHPVRGAARRAAIRRRLGIGVRMTRRSVDTAVVSARRASDRAVELVRIPVESAKDMVGSRNGHTDDILALSDDVAVPVAVGAESDLQPENLGEHGHHHADGESHSEAEAVGE